MDLKTENRIAAILMKEAAELRRQADQEGVHAYLRQQKARGRPNSRFLTATVLGVQQANRVAEVNEMWRVRQKEIELNNKLKGQLSGRRSYKDHSDSSSSGHDERHSSAFTSNRSEADNGYSSEEGGLKDEELEEFLQKRVKRGRGAVGSRMDDTGPYLSDLPADSKRKRSTSPDVRVKDYRVLGPEKPHSRKSHISSEDESDRDNWKKPKKVDSKKHSKKHPKDRSKKRKEKKSKHGHRSRHSYIVDTKGGINGHGSRYYMG